jgi:hypothetical protein
MDRFGLGTQGFVPVELNRSRTNTRIVLLGQQVEKINCVWGDKYSYWQRLMYGGDSSYIMYLG